jgi:DNA-binding transcriptional ArsR family regulator
LNYSRSVQDVLVIEDLDTLRVMTHPTRVAILELLTEPRPVGKLAEALGVPRTRLYHHVELLQAKGLVEKVAERRVRGMVEATYAATAKTYRPSERLLGDADGAEQVEALTALLFDTTKADLRRLALRGELGVAEATPQLALGRSIAHLSAEEAAEFATELEKLVARFDGAHREAEKRRPFALVWALYPGPRTV